jgi:hypothetical protein
MGLDPCKNHDFRESSKILVTIALVGSDPTAAVSAVLLCDLSNGGLRFSVLNFLRV